MRQIVLDTETTGLKPEEGHRVIEIGCVELVKRKPTGRTFHHYFNPERRVESEALKVHGITDDFLTQQPSFKDKAPEFFEFIQDAELVIHNAPFDVGFLNYEIKRLSGQYPLISQKWTIIDTLVMARERHPRQRNNLDALCKRYDITHHTRDLHGALLDAMILADLYLAMTGGQMGFEFEPTQKSEDITVETSVKTGNVVYDLKRVQASQTEIEAHEAYMAKMTV